MTEERTRPEAHENLSENQNPEEFEQPTDDNTTDVVDVEEVVAEADEGEELEQAASEADDEQQQLENALLQVEEFKNALQRERADFINFRKRVEREKGELRGAIQGETVLKFIPIVDDLERALNALPEDVQQNDWVEGFSLIYKKLKTLLDNMGIEPLDPLGEPFDPNFHDAIGSEDSNEYDSDHVIEVLQKGYMMDNRVLRPAIVRVAS
jgi:molecular chaperone GrpE